MTPERRRGRLGFRGRVLGLMAVLLLGASALGLFVQRAVLLGRLDDEVTASLEQEREEMIRLADGLDPETGEPFDTDVRAIFDAFLRRSVPGEGEVYLTIVNGEPYRTTFSPGGVRLDQDPGLVSRWAALIEGELGAIDTSAGPVRYMAVPLRSDDETLGVFVVANFERQERQEVEDFVRVEAFVSAGILFLSLAAAWLLAGRLLRPIRRLTETAQVISETDLSRRIPVATDDEIGRLAATFNDMLDRLDTAFVTQRRFVDDAGHELRTPITVVRGHLEMMGDDAADREETVALVTEELDRMALMVNDLLLLAKSEQLDFVTVEPVELSDLTTDLAVRARTLGDRVWRLGECGEGEVQVDPQRIAQAVLNLVRNAVEHTAPGDEIAIGSVADADGVSFWVRDHGPGIAPEDRRRIFERFDRGTSRHRGVGADGAGLGLSIVRAVADGHGGTVEVSDTHGGGATFTIRLPPCAHPAAAAPSTALQSQHIADLDQGTST